MGNDYNLDRHIPDHMMSLRWPVPPVPTGRWDRNSWAKYILRMCVCPNCLERMSYIHYRPVTEVEPGVYETRCSSCDHVWGRPPEEKGEDQ
jgi:hypothetical protein